MFFKKIIKVIKSAIWERQKILNHFISTLNFVIHIKNVAISLQQRGHRFMMLPLTARS